MPPGAERVRVLGSAERNLKMLRETLGIGVVSRAADVVLSGERDAVAIARDVISHLSANRAQPYTRSEVLEIIAEYSDRHRLRPPNPVADDDELNQPPAGFDRERAASHAVQHAAHTFAPMPQQQSTPSHSFNFLDDDLPPREQTTVPTIVDVYIAGKRIKPKSQNQAAYLRAIHEHDLVFATGPAGTGKTYLAVAAAVSMLKADQVRRIVLARPAVEAGEKLGYLPGDLQQKVNPYLRPLLDALNDMMDPNSVRRFCQSDVIEIVPLAFMRGRTLNDAVIILDEAQNTTRAQMKMFLTRMGMRSKMIVTGDTTQTDLPDPRQSGLTDAIRRLGSVPGVGVIQLQAEDVVRHDLVGRIVRAFDDEAPQSSRENMQK
ncbi:MAG: PhoH family protein [Phycisphaerales bacterium]|nr:PhoH family protein [Phycisphaerales bacterium]